MRNALVRGSLVLVSFDPTQGHEQRGARPAVVVSSPRYLSSVRGLVIVVPITSVDRGWPHHVLIGGNTSALRKRSFAMTEQPRAISQERIRRHSGSADERTLAEVDRWLRDFLAL